MVKCYSCCHTLKFTLPVFNCGNTHSVQRPSIRIFPGFEKTSVSILKFGSSGSTAERRTTYSRSLGKALLRDSVCVCGRWMVTGVKVDLHYSWSIHLHWASVTCSAGPVIFLKIDRDLVTYILCGCSLTMIRIPTPHITRSLHISVWFFQGGCSDVRIPIYSLAHASRNQAFALP